MKIVEISKWNSEAYQEYVLYLKKLKEEEYKNFVSRLTTTKYEILGIRIPILRKIASEISKGDIFSFLACSKSVFYEEVMIQGFVIAKLKTKEELLQYLENYISLIDNWAICDCFCNSLKLIKKDSKFWFSYFSNYLKSNEEFRIRVGLIVFLCFYVSDEYLETIFELIDSIKIDQYYVNMGIAWLLCECFIKYREKTLNYLLKSKVNLFVFNKTISKIKDSYRVTKEDKEYLNKLRKHIRRNQI